MKHSKLNVINLLLEIHGEISSLNVEDDFRHNLLEDVDLTMQCFKEKNILSVINCLGVIAGKLQTHLILSRCHYSVIEKLLLNIHRLQQILIRLPVCIYGLTGPISVTEPAGISEPKGPTGATNTTEPAGMTNIITTSSFPVSSFSIPKKDSVKSGYFDSSTYIVNYSNSYRRR